MSFKGDNYYFSLCEYYKNILNGTIHNSQVTNNTDIIKRDYFSRLYYTAFLYCRDFLRQNPDLISTDIDIDNEKTSHENIIKIFKDDVEKDLRELKRKRIKADYETADHIKFEDKEITTCYIKVKRILNQDYLKENLKS